MSKQIVLFRKSRTGANATQILDQIWSFTCRYRNQSPDALTHCVVINVQWMCIESMYDDRLMMYLYQVSRISTLKYWSPSIFPPDGACSYHSSNLDTDRLVLPCFGDTASYNHLRASWGMQSSVRNQDMAGAHYHVGKHFWIQANSDVPQLV